MPVRPQQEAALAGAGVRAQGVEALLPAPVGALRTLVHVRAVIGGAGGRGRDGGRGSGGAKNTALLRVRVGRITL